jgi:hypothetical protein
LTADVLSEAQGTQGPSYDPAVEELLEFTFFEKAGQKIMANRDEDLMVLDQTVDHGSEKPPEHDETKMNSTAEENAMGVSSICTKRRVSVLTKVAICFFAIIHKAHGTDSRWPDRRMRKSTATLMLCKMVIPIRLQTSCSLP